MKTNDRIKTLLHKLRMLGFQSIGIETVVKSIPPESLKATQQNGLMDDWEKSHKDSLVLIDKIRLLRPNPKISKRLAITEAEIKARLASYYKLDEDQSTSTDSVH